MSKKKESLMIKEFIDEAAAKGFFLSEIILDGEIKRVPRNPSERNKNCWYVGSEISTESGPIFWMTIGDWRADERHHLTSRSISNLSKSESKKYRSQVEEMKKKLEIEKEKENKDCSERAAKEFALAKDEPTEYIKRKSLSSLHGAKSIASEHSLILLVPMFDIEGKLWGLQRISPKGEKRFLAGQKTKGCFFTIKGDRDSNTVFICEGYATAASIFEATNYTVICAFYASNLKEVASQYRTKYKSKRIVICGDDDYETEKNKGNNPGQRSAFDAAAICNGKAIFPVFSSLEKRGTDFNDLHVLEGLESLKLQIMQAIENHNPSESVREPYMLKKDGVYLKVKNEDGEIDYQFICSPLFIIGKTRSIASENWGRALEWIDSDHVVHKWAMSMDLLAGDTKIIIATLLDKGLKIRQGKNSYNNVLDYIASCEPKKSIRCVSSIGWHKVDEKNTYVLPDQTFGIEKILLQNPKSQSHAFKQKGELENWQMYIAKYAINNPFVMLGLCVAFAAPLLEIMNAESGGFNIFGSSSTGKTTVLQVASSVWGGGGTKAQGEYIKSWRSTNNGLEGIATQHRDALLCLDEMSQATSFDVSEVSYMLANGGGKNRSKSDGTLQKASEWRLLFLSTGEIDLATKIAEIPGKKILAGQEVRVIDIPVSEDLGGYGIFRDLHDFDSGEKLSLHLKETTQQYYGTAIIPYLRQLVACSEKELLKEIKEIIEVFKKRLNLSQVDGQVHRVADRFGLLAAAGTLAVKMRILPFDEDEAVKCLIQCFRHWLNHRGTDQSREVQRLLSQVRAFFEANSESRFLNLKCKDKADQRTLLNKAGYRETINQDTCFYVHIEIFKNEICKGFPEKTASKILLEYQYLVKNPQASGSQYTTKKRIPNLKHPVTFYCFSSKVLEGVVSDEK